MQDSDLFLKLNGKLYDLRMPFVMGIVNITPDSFFALSRYKSDRTLLQQVENFLSEGATIIDIGGYSTRPQAEPVSVDEEIRRISEALEIICKKFPEAVLSVDTFRSPVARMAVQEYGVAMINDISGGTLDQLMFETIADLQVAYVLMHTRSTPQHMQEQTQYEDVVAEVLQFLAKRVAQLRLLGVHDVVIDPGFGFAKNLEQNYEMMSKLSLFRQIEAPLLVGISRKSMIYKLLGITPEEALNGTTALNMLALMGGASILRVHDVKEAVEAIRIFNAYRQLTK
ncbi:Dihydropteroate synthase [bioreactor metagenome]|uniref:dihydropteroate synthase n=1 Tax=bioreactor metagenome TaxID=1076179 RepID=A0A644VX84_9ZZZZ|nr:dihydropteroate synthase [Paludibacter sp.]